MLAFYYAMWCAGALLKAAAVCRMAKNGIARRYVLLAVFLAACSLRTLVLVFLWQHQAQYRRVYEASMPILNLLECAAVVGVFWVLVENYRKFSEDRNRGSFRACNSGSGRCMGDSPLGPPHICWIA
jgi:hypothetical protein